MSENNESVAPKWFKVVAVIALIWNVLGVFNYIMTVTMGPEALETLTEGQQAYMRAVPMWVTGAFAFAVWGGFAGTVALVLKKAWAVPVLVVSLAGVLIQIVYSFIISNYTAVFGTAPTVMFILVLPIGIYLVWLARSAREKGWIS